MIPTTVVFFILTALLYPITRFILPKIRSVNAQALFHFVYGAGMSTILFGTDIFYCLFMAGTCYACLLYCSVRVTLAVAVALLALSHLIAMIRPEDWALDMTGLAMVMFQKCVSLAFNIHDGRRMAAGEKLKRKRWESVAVPEPPSLLVWLAYAFTPYGCISNPFIEFKPWEVALHCGERPASAVPERDHALARFRFFGAFLWAAFAQTSMEIVTYETTYASKWFEQVPWFLRAIAVIPITTCLASRYFAGWWLVEAGFAEFGLPSAGIIGEDEISNLSMLEVLKSPTCDEWMRRWNHTTHLFWKNYLFTRMLNIGYSAGAANTMVFVCSMLWHGFRPVYLLNLPEAFLMMKADKFWNAKFPQRPDTPIMNAFHHFMVIWGMMYSTSSWYFPWIKQFLRVRVMVCFGAPIAYFVIAVIVALLPSQKKKEKPKAE